MPEFFQTRMGQQFYDSTMPRIAEALEKLVTSLEKPQTAKHTIEIRLWGGSLNKVDGIPEGTTVKIVEMKPPDTIDADALNDKGYHVTSLTSRDNEED